MPVVMHAYTHRNQEPETRLLCATPHAKMQFLRRAG